MGFETVLASFWEGFQTLNPVIKTWYEPITTNTQKKSSNRGIVGLHRFRFAYMFHAFSKLFCAPKVRISRCWTAESVLDDIWRRVQVEFRSKPTNGKLWRVICVTYIFLLRSNFDTRTFSYSWTYLVFWSSLLRVRGARPGNWTDAFFSVSPTFLCRLRAVIWAIDRSCLAPKFSRTFVHEYLIRLFWRTAIDRVIWTGGDG